MLPMRIHSDKHHKFDEQNDFNAILHKSLLKMLHQRIKRTVSEKQEVAFDESGSTTCKNRLLV